MTLPTYVNLIWKSRKRFTDETREKQDGRYQTVPHFLLWLQLRERK